MPPQIDFSSYILSDQASSEIFQTTILPAELPAQPDDAPPPPPPPAGRQPLALLMAGQTGAGKSRTAPLILDHMTRVRGAKPVHLVADVYKAYHPDYASLAAAAGSGAAARATGPDARRWLQMAADEVVRRRRDVLLESACRHRGDFATLGETFRQGGGGGEQGSGRYRVEVVFMAVPAGLSRLGILTRYFDGQPEGGAGRLGLRLTPKRTHDESHAELLAACRWVDQGGGEVVDQVMVLRRGNLVAFSAASHDDSEDRKERAGGQSSGPGFGRSVAEGVEMERTRRRLTVVERQNAEADIRKLEGIEEAAEALSEVKSLLAPLLDDAGMDESELPELKPLLFPGKCEKSTSNVLRLGAS